MPVSCWIVILFAEKPTSYPDHRLLITFMTRRGLVVDKSASYPQEKLSTSCDRSYWPVIQLLL